VADDDIGILVFLAQHNCGTLCTIEMAGSMEAVAPYIVLGVPFVRNCIHEGFIGHGLVPGGVEDDGLGNIGHGLSGCLDTHDIGRHVQRAEGNDLLQLLDDLIRYQCGLLEYLASMQDPVTDCADLLEVLDDAILIIHQHADDQLDGFLVGGGREFCVVLLLAVGFMLNGGILQSDSLYDSYSKNILVRPVVDLVLGR